MKASIDTDIIIHLYMSVDTPLALAMGSCQKTKSS